MRRSKGCLASLVTYAFVSGGLDKFPGNNTMNLLQILIPKLLIYHLTEISKK